MAERVSISQWAERWYYVIASHRPSQLGWRAYKLLQRRVSLLRPAPIPLSAVQQMRPREACAREPILQRHLSLRAARGCLTERATALLSGEFCFLNESRLLGPLGDIPLESVEPVSHLWRFQLQYHEFLLDLAAASQLSDVTGAQERVWPIIKAWMQSHPADQSAALTDAWHPFCLSRRIAVWLLLWQTDIIPAEHRQRVARSIEEQTRFLERHLEWDLRGNHLLENLRTLILAGAAWEGDLAERRLDRAIGSCKAQFREQILPGGEHFERSPMYHAQMLSAVLDIRDATKDVRPAFSATCQQTAARMAEFLEGVLHPDGQIALLSDSALEETPCPAILLKQFEQSNANSRAVMASSEGAQKYGQYWTWRSDDDFLLFDHGPVGADELPAHAHNDLLSIEASLGGQRLIVDSGVFDYDQSQMRHYCRSTAAHNVLQVDGVEQCDLWSRFRMGRRGRPIRFAHGADGDFAWASAIHDAYTGIGVPRVGRWIACRPEGPWIFADWADGTGEHDLDNWIHLAPDVGVCQRDDRTLELRTRRTFCRLQFHTSGELAVEHGWYCPDFGVRIEAPMIRFHQTSALPCMIAWTLDWGEWGVTAECVDIDVDQEQQNLVVKESGGKLIHWSPRRFATSDGGWRS